MFAACDATLKDKLFNLQIDYLQPEAFFLCVQK